MEKERILIKEDRELLNKICRDLPEYITLLNKVKESYEKLELGEFSQKVFNDILSKGPEKTLDKFHSNLIVQFNNAKITSSILRSNMIAETNPIQNEFRNAVTDLKSFKPYNIKNYIGNRYDYIKLHQITYENGRFFISDENEENILEQSCRTYLESDRDKELFEKTKAFANTYKELKSFLLKNNYCRQMTVRETSKFIYEGSDENIYTDTNVQVNSNFLATILRSPELYERASQL